MASETTDSTRHLILTLSLTDPTTVPIGPLVNAHLNSVCEVYPEPGDQFDPVWVEPKAAQVPTVAALGVLLSAARVGLEGASEWVEDDMDHVHAGQLLDALTADLAAITSMLTADA